ncbi:hypothetical protein [Hirschia maritima]|uniref:hypothetical protein n=1 Tax=Hirschia maritima TaxID=1121961 RepID=UPI00037F2DC2|nr:hypothetical protein [Hirschia maritima]
MFYYVILHGYDIHIPELGENDTPVKENWICGFIRSEKVVASSANRAILQAKAKTLAAWDKQKVEESNIGNALQIEVEQIQRLNLFEYIKSFGTGFIFYPKFEKEE